MLGVGQYFKLSDQVIILEDSKIAEMGPWESLSTKAQAIGKISAMDPQAEKANMANETTDLESKAKTSDDMALDLNRAAGDTTLYGSLRSTISLDQPFKLTTYSILLKIGWNC
jgi:hypothetical protein